MGEAVGWRLAVGSGECENIFFGGAWRGGVMGPSWDSTNQGIESIHIYCEKKICVKFWKHKTCLHHFWEKVRPLFLLIHLTVLRGTRALRQSSGDCPLCDVTEGTDPPCSVCSAALFSAALPSVRKPQKLHFTRKWTTLSQLTLVLSVCVWVHFGFGMNNRMKPWHLFCEIKTWKRDLPWDLLHTCWVGAWSKGRCRKGTDHQVSTPLGECVITKKKWGGEQQKGQRKAAGRKCLPDDTLKWI